jgi:hypothetical protein
MSGSHELNHAFSAVRGKHSLTCASYALLSFVPLVIMFIVKDFFRRLGLYLKMSLLL